MLQVNYFKVIFILLCASVAMAQNEGIRPWEMRNANGKGYVMISGIDSVMYYDVLDTYIRDSLGYSRIDSIKCVSDTIRIYTNNGQFKMPFSCSGGGGGSGDITAVNVTPYLTGGGTSGDVTVGIDTTGTIGVATKYDISGMGDVTGITATSPLTGGGTSGNVTVGIQVGNGSQNGYISSTDWTTFNNKIGGSGTANYVPFFSGTSTLTAQHDFQTLNTTNGFKLGLGFTSGGNSQFANYFVNGSTSSGLSLFDAGSSEIGLATSTSNRWSMMTTTSGDIIWSHHGGGSWAEFIRMTSVGDFTLPFLNSTNTKLVQATSTGVLDVLNHGTTGQVLTMTSGTAYGWAAAPTGTTNLTWSGISSTSATLNSSNGTDVTVTGGTGVTFSGTSTNLTINAASSGSTGLSNYIGVSNFSSSATSVYNATTTSPAKIIWAGLTGGNMTSTANGIQISSAGTYEILYSVNVSSGETAPNNPYLWAGLYNNDVLMSGSESFSHSPYTQNTVYHHAGKAVFTITNTSSFITLKVRLNGATANYQVSTSGAFMTIKKLN